MTGGKVLTGILTATLALSASGSSAGQLADQSPAPRFRASVDVVSVAAVVRDRRGRFVKDLSKQDFEIVEAGQKRPILDFRAEVNGPVKVAVLLDISGSMRVGQRTEDARQVANHVFAGLAGRDQAAVFTFDTALSQAQSFTSNRSALEGAIRSAEKPYGQTSLYDAIAQTARRVAAASKSGARGFPQRSAVVVITDGVDTRSNMTPTAVAEAASGIDVPVYIVAVMAAVDDPRESNHERSVAMASDLQELAQRTGGELFIASAPAHASLAARQLIDELRHQYVLAFEASSKPGWRPLEVRTRQDSLIVRARTGYHGGTPASEEIADDGSTSDQPAPELSRASTRRRQWQ
jgi:Ca-activated chloride channel homolog